MKKPLYIGVTNYRNYEDMHDSAMYAKGWNEAMHYIFDTEEEQLSKLHELKIEEFKKIV